jgi:hypothetical protein
MGLAWARHKQTLRSAIFGSGWGFLPEHELIRIHGEVTTKFRDLPFGPYDALVGLVGVDAANRLAAKGECRRRNTPQMPASIGRPLSSPSKAYAAEVIDLTSDDEPGPSRKRQRQS